METFVIKELLTILRNIVKSSNDYIIFKDYVIKRKIEHGSVFQFVTNEALSLLKLTLEEIAIPLKQDERHIRPFEVLEQITLSLSFLSGLNTKEWDGLCVFLYKSFLRITQPDSFFTLDHKEHSQDHLILISNPWVITLLLLEMVEISVVELID